MSRNTTLGHLIRTTGRKIDFYKTNALARRLKLMQTHGITLTLDVGANTGQYGRILRKAGYKGRLISFEPLASAFARLSRCAARDRKWQAVQLALGNRDGQAILNRSGDSQASSLLQMNSRHREVAPYFATCGTEKVEIRKLDSIWDTYVTRQSEVFLKLDTQGFEKQVLRGAASSLSRVRGVQIELSIVPLYEGSRPLPEMLRFMQKKGFALESVEYGFCDPKSGQMLQVDGIFFRT